MKRHGWKPWAAVGLMAMVMAGITAGCGTHQSNPVGQAAGRMGKVVEEGVLRQQVDQLLDDMYSSSIGLASTVSAETPDRAVRESCLRWKLRTASAIDGVASVNDVRARFILTWIVTTQARFALEEGTQPAMFGDQQERFVELVQQWGQRVEEVGKRHFPPQAIEAASDDIERLAAQRTFGAWVSDAAISARGRSTSDDISRLLSLPIGAVTGLRGAGDTAAAINRFTNTARDFAVIVRDLPERTRWQAELFHLEAEHSGVLSQALKRVESLQQQVVELSQTVTQMPSATRVEAEAVVARLHGLVNRMAIYAALLIVLTLICAVVYRVISRGGAR